MSLTISQRANDILGQIFWEFEEEFSYDHQDVSYSQNDVERAFLEKCLRIVSSSPNTTAGKRLQRIARIIETHR